MRALANRGLGGMRELVLEHYAQVFQENDIASAVLPELTDQDLN